jgi:CheY-like chemotaxis protein
VSEVLVVDDSADIRLLARTLLRRAGHQVREAGSAEEALLLIVAEAPDVVLLDLQLPGMDGWALLAELRAQNRLDRTRVVLFSAHVDPAELRRAPEAGASGYLVKPFTAVDLLACIQWPSAPQDPEDVPLPG